MTDAYRDISAQRALEPNRFELGQVYIHDEKRLSDEN